MDELQEGALVLCNRPAEEVVSNWRYCLENCDFITHYVTPEFFDEPSTPGEQRLAILCREGSDIAGIATGVIVDRSLVCGNSDRPQFAMARRASEESVQSDLARTFQKIARQRSLKRIDLFTWRQLPTLARSGFMESARAGVVILDLRLGADALFRRFSNNKKTNIKKALKSGVIVESTNDPADIDEYYEVYREWSKRKGFSYRDEQHFRQLFSLTASRKLFVARHAEKIIAGVIVRFVRDAVVEFSANSSLEQSLHLRPNDLLHWQVIQWACSEGFPTYSLAGSHLFLRKFGGPLVPTYRYRLDRTFLRRYAIEHLLDVVAERTKPMMPRNLLDAGRRLRDLHGRRSGPTAG